VKVKFLQWYLYARRRDLRQETRDTGCGEGNYPWSSINKYIINF